MSRRRFPLSSDQLELLLAFASCRSLQALAEAMTKDPSVVSRNLQQLAEVSPVIVKVKGRWQISPLGVQVNEQTRTYLDALEELTKGSNNHEQVKSRPQTYDDAALLVINAQMALLTAPQRNRCNSDAETNIGKILARWRDKRLPIIHVRHASNDPKSGFYPESTSFRFIPELAPKDSELVLDKQKSSAFNDTSLFQELDQRQVDTLVVTGFTANECIDATARQATELGFTTFVVGDASATFDITGPDGKLYRAERIHKLTMANLHALSARVITTDDLLQS